MFIGFLSKARKKNNFCQPDCVCETVFWSMYRTVWYLILCYSKSRPFNMPKSNGTFCCCACYRLCAFMYANVIRTFLLCLIQIIMMSIVDCAGACSFFVSPKYPKFIDKIHTHRKISERKKRLNQRKAETAQRTAAFLYIKSYYLFISNSYANGLLPESLFAYARFQPKSRMSRR